MKRFLIAACCSLVPAALVHAQPAVESDLAGRVKAMAEIPSTYAPVYSADGKRIAFMSSRSGTPQAWVVQAAGGEPRQLTRGDDPVGSVAWSPLGDVIAYDVARGGGYNAQIFLVDPDGGEPRRISNGGKEDNFSGAFTPDGRYWFQSNLRKADARDSWIHDPKTGKTSIAVENEGLGSIDDIQRPGNRALVSRYVTRGNNNLLLRDLDTGKEILLTPHEGPAIVSGALAPDGSAAYLIHNLGRDRLALSRIAIDAAGKPGPMVPFAEREGAELESFTIADDGRDGVLAWNVGGRTELELLSLPEGKRTPLPPAPGELVSVSEFSPRGDRLAMTVSGSTLPTSAWQFDLASQRYLPIAPIPFADTTLVKPELRRYQARDGLELSGWLYLPPGFKQPGPVVLSFHGGPEGQERPVFRADYQALLANGIAVFAPNIRGSSGFGKAFLALDNHEKRFDANRDIRDTADYLVDSGVGAKGRLGIMGGSYGGYAVMVGLTEFPDTFAAGADLFGIVNFETFFAQSTPWMGAVSVGEYGDPKTQSALLRELSPIHKIDSITAATLVMHGANDTNVPLVEAEQIVETLRKNGRDVEFLLFPDEGHGWRKIPNRVKSTLALTAFFRKHLVDSANPP